MEHEVDHYDLTLLKSSSPIQVTGSQMSSYASLGRNSVWYRIGSHRAVKATHVEDISALETNLRFSPWELATRDHSNSRAVSLRIMEEEMIYLAKLLETQPACVGNVMIKQEDGVLGALAFAPLDYFNSSYQVVGQAKVFNHIRDFLDD